MSYIHVCRTYMYMYVYIVHVQCTLDDIMIGSDQMVQYCVAIQHVICMHIRTSRYTCIHVQCIYIHSS